MTMTKTHTKTNTKKDKDKVFIKTTSEMYVASLTLLNLDF